MKKIRGIGNNKRKLLEFMGYKSIKAFRNDNPEFDSNITAYNAILELYNLSAEFFNVSTPKPRRKPLREVLLNATVYLEGVQGWRQSNRTNGDNPQFQISTKTREPNELIQFVNSNPDYYPSISRNWTDVTDKFDDSEIISNYIDRLLTSWTLGVKIQFNASIVKRRKTNNIVDIQAFDEHRFVSHKYISIGDELYKTTYAKENSLERSCWLNMLVDIYKSPLEAYYKKITVTHEFIHNIVAPNSTFKKHNNGYVFSQIKRFAQHFKIAIYLFDITDRVIDYYEPEKRNRNISPEVLYILLHNNHVYRFNNNLQSLDHKIKRYMEDRSELCGNPSKNYFIKEEDENQETILCDNYNQITQLLTADFESDHIRVLYNKPSCFDIWTTLFKQGIQAGCLMTNGELCFKTLTLQNVEFKNGKERNVTIYSLEEEGVNQHMEFLSAESFNHYMNKKSYASNQLLNKNYVSDYSENVKLLLNIYTHRPILGRFFHEIPEDFIQIDYNKFYTSILRDIQYLPVVNSFDEFNPYNGGEIKDYNLYFVEKVENDFSYPLTKFSLCYGLNIKGLTHIKILLYLQVSKIKKNVSSQVIQNIYQDDNLTPQMKKNIMNHIVGKFNKKNNTRIFTQVSTSYDESIAIKQAQGGKLYTQKINNEEIYINQIENSCELVDGFRLLSLLVYDIAHKRLLDLKEKIQQHGLYVYAANTDCLYIQNDIEKFEEFRQANLELFTFENKHSYEAIGKMKIDYNTRCRLHFMVKYKNESIINSLPFLSGNIKVLPISDEFNHQEISQIIDAHENIQVTALVAGAGKTSSFIEYAKQNTNLNVLIVSPYNTLCCDIRKKTQGFQNIDSITINKLLGLVFDGKDNRDTVGYSVLETNVIVFDEIYLLSLSELMKVADYMKRHDKIRFYATGDEYQNAPIDDKLYISNIKQYYRTIIASLFPNKIILEQNKRCKTDEDRKTIKALCDDIRNMNDKKEVWDILKKYNIQITNKITTTNNVCATNETVDWVNSQLCKALHNNKPYFIGQELICRSRINTKKKQAFINYTYKIIDIENDGIVLSDGMENTLKLSMQEIETKFRLPYARTCHSYQGLTEDKPITIYNLNEWFVDKYWIYTAITRTTQLKNIKIFNGDVPTITINKSTLETRINQHKNADSKNFKLNDYDDYITAEWLKKKIKSVKVCKYCKTQLDCSTFSVDRIDNKLPHIIMNCQIICRSCNIKKK